MKKFTLPGLDVEVDVATDGVDVDEDVVVTVVGVVVPKLVPHTTFAGQSHTLSCELNNVPDGQEYS